jgi:hypothetical protein
MVSVLVGFAFVLLVVTGFILYISPPGRVANWTDWSILTLRKEEWAAMHISFGALLLVTGIFHIIFNWRPLISYFKNRLSRRLGFRAEWAVAIGLGALIVFGTKADLPPFGSLAALSEEIKQSWDEPAQRAPIPHAELLTVAELADEAGVDIETAVPRLRASGVGEFTTDTVIKDLAEQSGLSAQHLYQIMAPSEGRGGHGQGRGGGGRGMGWKTLEQFCADEGIELADAVNKLQAAGITSTKDQTMREIAVENGIDRPYQILETIRGR